MRSRGLLVEPNVSATIGVLAKNRIGVHVQGLNLRRWLLGLGVPLLLACSGKSVGSGGKEATQASVEASLPGWCETTCKTLAACDGSADESDCAQNCRAELIAGARLSRGCAQAVDQFQSCVDAQGCAVLRSEICSLDDAEACDDDASDVDNEPPGAGPVPGTGGSSPGPGPSPPPMVGSAGTSSLPAGPGMSGTAGTSSSGPIPFDPPVHCSAGGGSASGGPSPGGAQVICEESYGDCSNGSSYYTVCVTTSAGQSSCSCFVDNQLSTAFDPGGTCPTLTQLNHGCGWNIQ